jgi:murein L,D-transpeptidase YcbB/YkuD
LRECGKISTKFKGNIQNRLFDNKEGTVIRNIFIIGMAAILLVGCATTKSQPMTSELQMRVGELERELETKDEQIKDMEMTVKELSYEVERMKSVSSRQPVDRTAVRQTATADGPIIRVSASAQEVQRALKNAGYYQGNIDGNIGSGTRAAISQFQKDKGLKSDGVVGKQTWTELKTFLE